MSTKSKKKKQANEVHRVVKINIYPDHEYYEMLLEFCHLSKNLYNKCTYILRQAIINGTKFPSKNELSKQVQDDKKYPDYDNMPMAQSAQQTVKNVSDVFKAYFRAIKDFKANPEKYTGQPRLPKYKKKNGVYPITFTNQNCKMAEDHKKITFPQCCDGLELDFDADAIEGFVKLSEVKIVPKTDHLVILITYTCRIKNVSTKHSRHIMGCDIGLNNLVTCADNYGKVAFIIDGLKLKSINQWYNKQIAKCQETLIRRNQKYTSKYFYSLWNNRNNQIENYLHQVSRFIVDQCQEHGIDTFIVGYNKGWKQEISYSAKFNQKFQQVPFRRLLDLIKYKCEDAGIIYIETEESYTSGTSFVDGEKPVKKNYDKKRQISID